MYLILEECNYFKNVVDIFREKKDKIKINGNLNLY